MDATKRAPGTNVVRKTILATALAAGFVPLAVNASDANATIYLSGLKATDRYTRYIVKYRDSSDARASQARLDKALQRVSAASTVGLRHLRRLAMGADLIQASKGLDAVAAEQLMRSLAADPAVEYVQVDQRKFPLWTPNDTYYDGYQWSAKHALGGIFADWAWSFSRGTGVVVAVLDTGLVSHPDLNAKRVPGYDFITDLGTAADGNGRDNNPADPGDGVAAGTCGTGEPAQDSSWHGTHVAGTIGAQTNNGAGVAGMAPNAKILPVRVLGKCGGWTSDITDAVIWASGGTVAGVPANANPAEVINMSLGGAGSCSPADQAAINSAVSRGSVVVIAAGNDNGPVSSPGNCNNAITVAATHIDGGRASYSNYGPQVDVAAPGGGARSGIWDEFIISTHNDGTLHPGSANYGGLVGTSMAAPHVAAVVALMQSITANSPARVEQLLKNSARPLTQSCSGGCGAGIVNAEAAVKLVTGGLRQNANNIVIPTSGAASSAINFSAAGKATANTRVGVYINHGRPSDLLVRLRAPDGSLYVLHNRASSTFPGINRTYTVNVSTENIAGTWQLQVYDQVTGTGGKIDKWTMHF